MNKTELTKVVAQELGINQKEGIAVTEAVFKVIADALASGDSVKIAGFGNFTIKETAARTARNPKTGEAVSVPEGRKVSFKVAQAIKDAVNA